MVIAAYLLGQEMRIFQDFRTALPSLIVVTTNYPE